MKFLLICFLLYCLGNNFTLGIDPDEKWYDYFIEQFKTILKNGYPPMGIPKLDPYDLNTKYCFKNRLNTLNLDINGLLSNFSDFYVNNVQIKPNLHSTLELQFTSINFIGQYNLIGQLIKAIPLDGSGNIELFLGNVVLLTEFMILGNNRTIQISNFKFNYDIGVGRLMMTGLLEQYHLNNIIEHFLGDAVPSGLNLLRYNIQKLIDQFTPTIANDWLKEMDPKHIIEELGSQKVFLARIRKTFYYGNLPVTERLSLPATELAADLYSEVKARHSVERLRLEEASEISRNACISPCSLVLAIIYLEQLKATNFSYLDKVTPSDLFIVSLMIATKFLNDSGEEDDILNSEWAASVGLSLNKVNRLEREFLAAIEWKVFVKQNIFWERLRMLEKDIALKEGNKRGWFSYTELEKLMDTINAVALAQTLFTVSAVCLASYTAALLTIVGSTLLVTQLPKYSTSNLSTSDVLNVSSTSMLSPVSINNSYDYVEECEQTVINLINMENSIEEIKEYLQARHTEWNEDRELNFTGGVNGYITSVTNYLRILSDIEYLPSKIGSLPVDNGYFLHNCFS